MHVPGYTVLQDIHGRKYQTFRHFDGNALRSDVDHVILVILNTSDHTFIYFHSGGKTPDIAAIARSHTGPSQGASQSMEIPARHHGDGTLWYKCLGLVLTGM